MHRLLLLAALTSATALADGLDDPSFYEEPDAPKNNPNYYRDFDKNPCKYPIWPDGFICRNTDRIEYIPTDIYGTTTTVAIDVPEPNPELLLYMGITALFLKTRIKK